MLYIFDDTEEAEDFSRAKGSARYAMKGGDTDVLSDHSQAPPMPDEATPLSQREVEVLRLVALAWETPRIATQLGISPHTVRNNIRNLRNKLSPSRSRP